jgi:uncharacterized membrane protein required for colicin V production
MDWLSPNTLFLIIIAVIALCYFSGRRAGLIRTLVPVASVFGSVWIMAVAFSVLKNDVMTDVTSLDLNRVVIDLLAFVVSFFLLKWLIKSILHFFKLIGDAPIVNPVNKFLGGVAGMIGGVVMIWLVFFFILLFVGEEGAPEFYAAVNGNEIVRLLYNHNLIMTFINFFVFSP